MFEKNHLSHNDWSEAHRIASNCKDFVEDVEEEWIADEMPSCYNCRYRRCIPSGIKCIKPSKLL
jgi:hypothetical protein